MNDRIPESLSGKMARIEEFRKVVEGYVQAEQAKHFPSLSRPVMSLEFGKKYCRVVIASGSKSVYGFVEIANGDLFMAAGYKKPALNGARANIYADDYGLSGCGRYGVKYKGQA